MIGFSSNRASQAELVLVEAADLTRKPEKVSWEVAGGLYVAGVTAWGAVHAVQPKEGETVVISGAAGGVGSLAVQLARRTGAMVIGLASESNHAWLKSLGVIPVAYGDGVADRIRAAAPAGVDQLAGERVRRRSMALEAWFGGTEPVSAEMPPWPEGSLGHRLLAGTPLGEAQDAPSLLTAQIPGPRRSPPIRRHWTIATDALIRAVVFDGLTLDHPAVGALLEVLTSVVEAEIAHMRAMDDDVYSIGPFDNDDEVGFPALDGPVFLLGRAPVEAVWTVVGDDSLADVPSVLVLALDGVVPGLDAPRLVDALIAASYTCEDPTDTRPLQRLMNLSDNPLETPRPRR